MTSLLALRYPNRRLALRLRQAWDEGWAVLPISPALPERELRALLAELRPSRIEDESATVDLPEGVEAGAGVAVVIPTSGTSGRPKGVELSHRALQRSAEAYARRLETAPGERWLSCLPLSHIGGLGVVYRSLVAGTEPVVQDGFDVSAIDAERNTTLISLVPTTLMRLIQAGVDLARYRAVLVGGAPLSPSQAAAADRAGVRVVSTYGMTETCGACCFDGIPLEGVEVDVVSDQILVHGATLMDGYRLRPELTSTTLKDGWLQTADRGRIGPGGRVEILGRMDDVIVTGGEKVSALEVENLLETHPLISDAAVAGVPDEKWGSAVAALVVPRDGTGPSLEDLKGFLAPQVSAHKLPKRLKVVRWIPRTQSGKIRRRAVLEILLSTEEDPV